MRFVDAEFFLKKPFNTSFSFTTPTPKSGPVKIKLPIFS